MFSSRSGRLFLALLASIVLCVNVAVAADTGTLNIHVDRPGAKIGPTFYGLMTEEINHSYDGGLYAELIQNRVFEDTPVPPARARGRAATQAVAPVAPVTPPGPPEIPFHWSVVTATGGAGDIHTDATNPVNA